MTHTCTHLPDDPPMVLAVPVNEVTYEAIYLQLPTKTHLEYETVRGEYITVPVNEVSWGWMTKEDFEAEYQPIFEDEPVSDTNFTLYEQKPKQ